MPFELLSWYLKLPVFALVAARLAGLIMFQPVLGAMAVPPRLRVLLVLGLAAIVTPFVSFPAQAPDSVLGLLLAMVSEVLLGALIGLACVMCFLGLQWGGMLVAQESGLAFGHIADPTSEREETVLGVFYLQLAVVVFLVVGGHRALVSACLDTFETIPLLAESAIPTMGAGVLLKALEVGGHVAVRVAAPALLALFLVNVAMGFISRTMPQFNIIAVGFSLKGMVAFLLIAVSLPTAMSAFIGSLEHVYQSLADAIASAGTT